MENGGLLLGAAILGGGYLAINSLSGEDGGGGGSAAGGVVNIIEDAAAAAQGITSTVKEVTNSFSRFYEIVDDGKGIIDDIKDAIDDTTAAATDILNGGKDAPTGDKAPFFETASAAGGGFGAGLGGALGSAFLGLYGGSMAAGAQFIGRQDVTPENALDKFKAALPVAKENTAAAVLYPFGQAAKGAGFLVKAAVMGGNVDTAINNYSGSRGSGNNTTFTPSVVNIPKVNNTPIGGGGSTAFKQSHADFVATFRAKNAAPAAATTPKKSVFDSVRSWFN